MTIKELKKIVYEANMDLVKHELVILTWGNVSAIDREKGLVVIKPSGVEYSKMKPEDMVVVDLETGKVVEGKLNPSSDTPTHLELYRKFPKIGSVIHTHSTFATSWAQAGKSIPCFGTTHADAFYGSIPCAPKLTAKEIKDDYELNTGKAIVKLFKSKKLDYVAVPGVILQSHGPFVWGKDVKEAVKNAVTLEEVAKMAYIAQHINPQLNPVDKYLLDKHYNRKHGKNAYYGQKKN